MNGRVRGIACVAAVVLWACAGSGDPGDAAADGSGRDVSGVDAPGDLPGDPGADRSASDPGFGETGDPGVTDPEGTDPGTPDPGTPDPGIGDPGSADTAPSDPGSADPGDADVPALGTKAAGELCKEAAECSLGMSCIAGQYTPAHCNIQCASNDQCLAISPGTTVTCQAIGGTGVCMWTCLGGNKCPGGLRCDGYFCG